MYSTQKHSKQSAKIHLHICVKLRCFFFLVDEYIERPNIFRFLGVSVCVCVCDRLFRVWIFRTALMHNIQSSQWWWRKKLRHYYVVFGSFIHHLLTDEGNPWAWTKWHYYMLRLILVLEHEVWPWNGRFSKAAYSYISGYIA